MGSAAASSTTSSSRRPIRVSLVNDDEGFVDHVVLYTWDGTARFTELARDRGISAVVLKSVSGAEPVEQLERIVCGEPVRNDPRLRLNQRGVGEPLSLREREVLALPELGSSNPEIADELFLSADIVTTSVRRVFAKLGVDNRTSAALMAADDDLAPPSDRLARRSRLTPPDRTAQDEVVGR